MESLWRDARYGTAGRVRAGAPRDSRRSHGSVATRVDATQSGPTLESLSETSRSARNHHFAAGSGTVRPRTGPAISRTFATLTSTLNPHSTAAKKSMNVPYQLP